jgi:hypothetical protein
MEATEEGGGEMRVAKEVEYSRESLQGVLEEVGEGGLIDIRVPASELSSASRHIKSRFLWGTGVYTPDSDPVAAAQHSGHYLPGVHPSAGFSELVATIRVARATSRFPSRVRNGLRSHSWGLTSDSSSFAFQVVQCRLVAYPPEQQQQQQQQQHSGTESANVDTPQQQEHQPPVTKVLERTFGVSSSSPPTLVPTSLERLSGAKVGERRNRVIQEVTIQYNLCNEPWLKFNFAHVADRGLKVTQWTSSKLRRETLYLESNDTRYELVWDGNSKQADSYRFAQCSEPIELEHMQAIGIPHPLEYLSVICSNTPWEDFRWSVNGLTVKGVEYEIMRILWLPRSDNPQQEERRMSVDDDREKASRNRA